MKKKNKKYGSVLYHNSQDLPSLGDLETSAGLHSGPNRVTSPPGCVPLRISLLLCVIYGTVSNLTVCLRYIMMMEVVVACKD
jgi:hypothetical protein